MKKIIIMSVIGISVVFAFFLNVETEPFRLPIYHPSDIDPDWVDGNQKYKGQIHKIPDFSFTDQNGDEITNKTMDGKIYVADFFFTTCPGICPTLTKHMSKVQAAFKGDADLKIISHTVHPENDSVAVLKAYGEMHNIDNKQWYLVTGEKAELYGIARGGYFSISKIAEKIENAFIHTENFILVDNERRIRGIYNGTIAHEVNRLIEDIDLLKKEL
ncbi:MAG: SCO family protein [Candidatus Marinimicrobia bacterium]|nr:SCO family protein [Candidatus Neomarinimicrobiota bacterium]